MLNNKKLLASDYDGTFHRHNEEDLKANLSAVEKWQNNGNIFVFSTGRDVASMMYEKKVKNINYDYMISLNGSFVVDSENNVIFKKPLAYKLSVDLVNLLKEEFGEELIISNGFDGYNTTFKEKSKTCEVAKEVYERNSKIYSKNLENVFHDEIFLLGCATESLEKAKEFRKIILKKYGNDVDVFINVNYINIVPKGISKASALELVMNHTKIHKNNISAIGDDLNDIPMLEKFNGYTVENGKDEAKKIAKKIYSSVAHLIEDHI